MNVNKIKRAGTDVPAGYDINYSKEKILNCFPNYYINLEESFFSFVTQLYLTPSTFSFFYVSFFLIVLLLCQSNADGKCVMNLAFHKHYEFSQIAQSILSK